MVNLRTGAFLVVALTILAGCTAQSQTSTTDQAAKDVNVQATATTGVIRGVVVDDAVRPLAGVQLSVTAQSHTRTTNSTATGSFGFQGLAPGTYFVKAHKPGYKDVQTSADVKAGDSNPPVTKVLLPIDSSFVKPYAEVNHFRGFIDCGTTTAVITLAVCSVPNGPTCGMNPLPCTGNVTNDNFITAVDVIMVPNWIQHELIWTSTQQTGDMFQLASRTHHPDGSFEEINGTTGISPIYRPVDKQEIGKFKIGQNGTGLFPTVFSGGMQGTQVCDPTNSNFGGVARYNCTFGTGATAEQEFDLYTVIFYGFDPPANYRFVNDGPPTPPA